ncbi:MAG: tRNA adenosine(34) deaminase TadA [Clostridia bacterium]|nr:tRNA adenosine(34) deaminase TadA [Clostridia bacterium]
MQSPLHKEEDLIYMRRALALAEEAAVQDEVPVGALIVHRGEIIAEAFNTRETSKCATHHAEILVIEAACRRLGGWRLPDCTLYVTLEPCPMCAGAIVNSRIDRVVYAAPDLRAGAFGSVVDLNDLPLNHKPQIAGGVCCEESKNVLSAYFRAKRKKKE